MPTIVLVIGPNGAGKTTWIRAQAGSRTGEYFTLSTDLLLDAVSLNTRKRRHYSPAARCFGRYLWQAGIEHAMRRKRNLILEATAPRKIDRDSLIGPFRRAGWNTEIIVIATPIEVALEQIKADQARPWGRCWRQMVERWHRLYEPVDADEAGIVMMVAGRQQGWA